MKESPIQADIRLALAGRGDCAFWRNSVGEATYYKGGGPCPVCKQHTLGAKKYVVPYGLCPGSADLIGFVEIEIGGLVVAAFTGIEVKAPRGAAQQNQRLFRNLVSSRHGVAEFARSVEQAHMVVNKIRRLEPWK